MKVVQVIGNMRGGGAERVALELHRAFARLGERSEIWVTDREKAWYDLPEGVRHVPAEEMVEKLRSETPDLIFAHMQKSAELLQPLKGARNLFFVIHTAIHERLRRKSFLSRLKHRKKLRKIYHEAQVVTVSKGIRDDLEKLKIVPRRSVVLYNPFNFDTIRERGNETVEQFDVPYIVAVGSLNSVKRHDSLLKACAKAEIPHHLVLLGEGKQREKLRSMAERLGISERVHLKGWVPNPYAYIKNAALLVSSSEAEGFGNVLVEALALGTPVVSTDCNHGPREIMLPPLDAFLARVNDPEDLAQKIEAALIRYPPIPQELLSRFDFETIAKHYLSLAAV